MALFDARSEPSIYSSSSEESMASKRSDTQLPPPVVSEILRRMTTPWLNEFLQDYDITEEANLFRLTVLISKQSLAKHLPRLQSEQWDNIINECLRDKVFQGVVKELIRGDEERRKGALSQIWKSRASFRLLLEQYNTAHIFQVTEAASPRESPASSGDSGQLADGE